MVSSPTQLLRALAPLVVVAGLLAGLVPTAGAATGPDVSNWQHPQGQPINWSAVRSAGHEFAFIKATEGPGRQGPNHFTNPWFAPDWAAAGAAGLYRGAYHYAQPRLPVSSAIADARHFVSVTGALGHPLDLPPVLDIEETGGLGPNDLAAWSQTWLGEVERLTGRRPMIYTGRYFWQTAMANSTAFTGYRLWFARWTTASDPGEIPGGWPTWTFWQWSSTGSIPGIPATVDLNRYCCSSANLAALAGSGRNPAAANPFGALDMVIPEQGAVRLGGWAIDPDTQDPIDVHVYAGADGARIQTAKGPRSDVGAAYPGFGPYHGFDVTVPTAGRLPAQLCAYGINVGGGTSNSKLGCVTITGVPGGRLDGVSTPAWGGVEVRGKAVDPDSTDPTPVHVYVDGKGAAVTSARLAGGTFAVRLPSVPPGRRSVCAYAVNQGAPNANTLLGCRVVDVRQTLPFGELDQPVVADDGVEVSGWAIDADAAGPIGVHVYVDGRGAANLTADQLRAGAGQRGFAATLAMAPGSRRVCAYGINVGPGSNALLGCRTVSVPRPDPTGRLETVRRAPDGSLVVGGWARDPDTTGPIDVHVYVESTGWAVRADQAHPVVGPHGFSAVLPAPGPGSRRVCAYGINEGSGSNRLLGCIDSGSDPYGALSPVQTPPEGGMEVSGWAVDPDTDAPVDVHLYVDGVGRAALTADADGGWVPGHSFTRALSAEPGRHTVCAYGINQGPGSNSLLGCLEVVVPPRHPYGGVDPLTVLPNGLEISGWADDADTTGPVSVHVYVDGLGTAVTATGLDHPTGGPGRGFRASLAPLAPGGHLVCAYAINAGPSGSNALLGCEIDFVPAPAP